MRVVVTGGAGYIGRFCVRSLLEAGHHVVVVDRVATPGKSPAVSVRADISDQETLARVLRDQSIDAVLHLAAEKSVAAAMAEPGPHLRNNVAGSITVFEAMRTVGVTKLVFSSSAAVYGDTSQAPMRESVAMRPVNPYGAGKEMVERIIHWYAACHGFDALSLRYFNAAGAAPDGSLGEDWSDASNLVPIVMKSLLGKGPPVPVYGTDYPTPDGTAIRDYVHVEDLAAGHLAALDVVMAGTVEEAINLGTGRGHSVREVIAEAGRAAGHAVPAYDAPRRPGDSAAVWADVSRAKTLLGWTAVRTLTDIVGSALRWHSGQVRD